MMPSRSPRRTSRLTPRTAVSPPKRFVTDSSVSTVSPRAPAGGDAERLGGVLVLAHAGQLVADARALEIHLKGVAHEREHEDQVEPRDVAEPERREAGAEGDGHALRARGEAAPAARDDLEDLGERDGGEREVRALEPVGEVADQPARADGEPHADGEPEPRVEVPRAHERG